MKRVQSRNFVIALGLIAMLAVDGASAAEREASSALDPDRNGLYDDPERKVLVDVFLRECPELHKILEAAASPVVKALSEQPEDFREGAAAQKKALTEGAARTLPHSFDIDGDGKVTIQEQESRGGHPLSLLVPRRILQSDVKIPWAIDIFPEWLSLAYLQEDVAVGAVAEHAPRGTLQTKAVQAKQDLQPTKSALHGGIEFPANAGRVLSVSGLRDIRWDGRWCLFTFRIDAQSGDAKETVLLDINQGNGSNQSSPKVSYVKDTGLSIQYVGLNKEGLDRRIMTARNVVADGKTWNVLVCGIRFGQMFASVNGLPLFTETKQPPRFSGEWPRDSTSYIGNPIGAGNMAWAYDALVFGLTEPSEAMVQKMTGWAAHRLGFQASLPNDHPYKQQRPVLDAEDFPHRYVHDDEKWNAWGQLTKNKAITRVNAGGPRVGLRGFERVFLDDFRASRVKASSSGEGDLWVGPGFNLAVGGSAPLVTPGQEPDTYPYDAVHKKQILSLVNTGNDRWRASAINSINDLGHGYAWAGPKIFRVRCMLPKVNKENLAGGLFPAFWSYCPENLVWRTANRIEVDYFEVDGANGAYLNGLSSHYHYPYLKGESNIFASNRSSYNRFKVYGGELNEEKSKIPGGLFFWDGQYHTWEYVIDEGTTYVNVTVPNGTGGERWVEVCRCPTAPIYLERLDLQLDYALKAKGGAPKDGKRQDFVVDSIEVLQKTAAISTTPEPFVDRPLLSGTAAAGSIVTCRPNLKGITDIRYFWFADDYPLTYGPENTYSITRAEVGKAIRCMVKAVGARDMPEAWSNVIK